MSIPFIGSRVIMNLEFFIVQNLVLYHVECVYCEISGRVWRKIGLLMHGWYFSMTTIEIRPTVDWVMYDRLNAVIVEHLKFPGRHHPPFILKNFTTDLVVERVDLSRRWSWCSCKGLYG